MLLAAHAAELREVAFAEQFGEKAVEQGGVKMGNEGEGEEENVGFFESLGGKVAGKILLQAFDANGCIIKLLACSCRLELAEEKGFEVAGVKARRHF